MTPEDEAIHKLDALKPGKNANFKADQILPQYLERIDEIEVARAFLRAEGRVGFWRL